MAGRSRRGECPLRERSGRAWNPGGQPDLPVLVSGGDGRAPAAHRERDALEPLPRLRRRQARTARLLPQLQRGVLGSTTLVGRSDAARAGKIDPDNEIRSRPVATLLRTNPRTLENWAGACPAKRAGGTADLSPSCTFSLRAPVDAEQARGSHDVL